MAKTPKAIAVCTHKQKHNNKDLPKLCTLSNCSHLPKLCLRISEMISNSLFLSFDAHCRQVRQVQIALIGPLACTILHTWLGKCLWEVKQSSSMRVSAFHSNPVQFCIGTNCMDTSERIDGERAQSFSAIGRMDSTNVFNF